MPEDVSTPIGYKIYVSNPDGSVRQIAQVFKRAEACRHLEVDPCRFAVNVTTGEVIAGSQAFI